MSDAGDRDASDLQRHTVHGVLWTGGARAGQQALQFGVTIVLARLLGPSDFGLFAMVAVFTGFASLLVDFGLSAALVQKKALEERHLSTAFWMNLGAGVALTALMAAAAPAIAAFYSEPQLLTLTLVLAGNFLIASPVIVQAAILHRSMNFRRLATVETLSAVIAGALAITAAVYGLGVWSLAIQVLVGTTMRLLAFWLLTSWRPSFRIDRQAARELWGYSSHLAGFSTLNYWTRNLDNLLVGRFVGPVGLGIYSRAYSTMMLPLNQVSSVVSRVMFPALARIQDDHNRVKRAYLRVVAMIALVTFPTSVGLLVVAKPFVLTLYGSAWTGVVPILQILCLAALTQSIGTTVGWIYQSQGRTDWLFRWGVVSAIVTLAAFGIGIHWGVEGIAIAYVIRTYALTYLNYSIPGRLIDMTFGDVVGAVWKVLAASLAMGGCVWLCGIALPADLSPATALLAQTAIGVVSYVALLELFAVKAYLDFRTTLRRHLRVQRAPRATASG